MLIVGTKQAVSLKYYITNMETFVLAILFYIQTRPFADEHSL